MRENSQLVAGQASGFRNDLQGLRAIAVTLVVLAHAGVSQFEGGFIGVDVFFVLSGYLITGILVRELESSDGIDLLRFYSRRLRRLLPALLAVLCLTFAAGVWLLSTAEARSQLASSPFAGSWTSNFFFALRTVDYFDELSAKDLFLHTWSLGVEEQFYLVWPAYLLLLSGLGARLGGGRLRWLWSGLLLAFGGSLGLCVYWTATEPEFAFYMMPSRIWQLSLGAIVLLASTRLAAFTTPGDAGGRAQLPRALFASGLVLVIGSSLVLDNLVSYPGLWALFPSFGAALVILAGAPGISTGRSPLAHPVLVWLGDRSYSFYLWHWPVLILGFSLGFAGQPAPVLGLVLLALLISMLSYRYIEYPFWRGAWSHGRPAPVALACVAAIAGAVALSLSGLRQLPEVAPATQISHSVRGDRPVLYTMGCDAWYENALVQPCLFGDERAERTAVIIGDSIGLQWFSAFPEVFAAPLWRVVVVTKSSCPIVDETFFYSRIGRDFKICDTWRDSLVEQLASLHPEVIVLGNAATYPFSEQQWREGSERIFARLSPSAEAVFAIPGTPLLGFDGPGCLDRHISPDGMIEDGACTAPGKAEQVAPVAEHLERAAGGFANVHVLNLNDLVCPGGTCRAMAETGVPVYRDGQHLTDSFVRQQLPVIKSRIQTLFPEGLK